ncbi:MAG: chromate transporter [Bacillota bacterium]|nr:chromate transporter [Bacillota bacterium]
MAVIILTLYWTFLKIGLFTIGGGYAMIPLMKTEVINGHGWLSAAEFIDIIAVAEITPGPVSVNAATFIGYRLAGIAGALIATLGVITPSFILLMLLSRFLFKLIKEPAAGNFLNGLRSALVALILVAAFTLGQSAVIDLTTTLIFLVLLAASLLRRVNPLYLLAVGALCGLLFFPYGGQV